MTNSTHRQLPTPREIVAHLDRYVYGQHQAKRDLAVAVYNHYLGLGYHDHHAGTDDATRGSAGAAFGRQHILLMGPTGSGKTYLIRLIAERLGVPWVFVAATSLVQAGYVGTRIENAVGALYQRTDRDRGAAERGIILVDEIDKIAAHRGAGGPDVGGEGVQQALLSVLDGRVVQASTGGSADFVMGEVDTSTILFVCAGAFVGLEEQAQKRRWGGGIGFHAPPPGARGGCAYVADHEPGFGDELPDTEDLIAFGFIPEFVGRFATVSATRALTAADLVAVLERAEDSVLPRQRRLFAVHGIDLDFTPGALRAVAEEACALGTGARGLSRVVLRSLADVDYRLPELADQGVTRVTVTAEAVRGYGGVAVKKGRGRTRAKPRGYGVPRCVTVAEDLRTRALAAPSPDPADGAADGRAAPGRGGFTDPRGLTPGQINERLTAVRKSTPWTSAHDTARIWWDAFESENKAQPHVALRTAEEVLARQATLVDFFNAYVFSGIDNIKGVLHYLDYLLCKREWERNRKRKAG